MFKSIEFFKGKSRGNGLLRRYPPRNDVCSVGRSMIEMLGVLAIVGVLSVGGIAGYSKAMEKFKLNKTISEYSYLIYGLLEHVDDLRHLSGNGNAVGVRNVVESLNLLPQSWKQANNPGMPNAAVRDNNGNIINIFIRYNYLTFDFYLGGWDESATETNSLVSSGFSAKVCTEMFSNLAIPLSSSIHRAYMYDSSKNNQPFWGAAYCSANNQCLSSLTLAKINDICRSCNKSSAHCAIVLEF